jgi:hypothetical protein
VKKSLLIMLVALVALSLFVGCKSEPKKAEEAKKTVLTYDLLIGTWQDSENNRIVFDSTKQEAKISFAYNSYNSETAYEVEINGDKVNFKLSLATFSYTCTISGSSMKLESAGTSKLANFGTDWTKQNN